MDGKLERGERAGANKSPVEPTNKWDTSENAIRKILLRDRDEVRNQWLVVNFCGTHRGSASAKYLIASKSCAGSML